MPNRPGRLRDFDYKGRFTYFLTLCVDRRVPAFEDLPFALWAIEQLLQQAKLRGFAVLAYSLMPDHAHIIPEGRDDNANLRSLMYSWNTRTGFAWRRRTGSRLWQSGYYDHVLRERDNPLGVCRYVLMNPVRAGIVKEPQLYPLSGSSEYTIEDIISAAQDWKPWW
jgi:REP element-mobilizing transposase RayT